MTDTSESNRVPKHKVTSQYAEAQPTFHAVLSLKKSTQVSWRTSINHAWRAMASFNTQSSLCALLLKAERHDSVYFFDHSCFMEAVIHFHLSDFRSFRRSNIG